MAPRSTPDLCRPEDLHHGAAAARLPISGFGAGTVIACDDGGVPVEWLRPGDRVLVRDGAPQPVRWIGRDCLQHAPQNIAAARLPPNAAADRRKQPDTLLAAGHRVMLSGWKIELNIGLDAALARACDLGAAPGRFEPHALGPSSVFLIALDHPDIILANGLWVESLQLSPSAQSCLADDAAEALMRLDLDHAAHLRPAARCLNQWEVQNLGQNLKDFISTGPPARKKAQKAGR